MPTLICPISQSLQDALERQSKEAGEPISHLVSSALSWCLGMDLHTPSQVSTSDALVQGVYQKTVSSHLLLKHGNVGLDTLENLDGEMVVLDGAIYQVRSDGTITEIAEDFGAHFATVAPFVPDRDEEVATVASLEALTEYCNRYRESDSLFYAIRVDGHFHHVRTRAMRATIAPLAQAVAAQPEFDFDEVDGTLVGIWAPQLSNAFNIAGYHFHFLSADGTTGGHLLDCSGSALRVGVEKPIWPDLGVIDRSSGEC
jgi:acetolactate decarboxylase